MCTSMKEKFPYKIRKSLDHGRDTQDASYGCIDVDRVRWPVGIFNSGLGHSTSIDKCKGSPPIMAEPNLSTSMNSWKDRHT